MLIIRFFRTGKKNQSFFKIVVMEKGKPPRGGNFVEQVGFYNPLTKEKKLKPERAKYWLSVGAKPSDTVYNLLIKEGILEGKKIPLHKKKKTKEEKPAGETVEAPKKPEAPEKEPEKPKEESPKIEEKPKSEEPKKEEIPPSGLDK